MNDAELEQAIRELNVCVDEAVHYINAGQDCFKVSVGAFEIQVRFELAKLGKPETKGETK